MSKRFSFVELDDAGRTRGGGPAPYLDYRGALPDEAQSVAVVFDQPWLRRGAEELAVSWAIEHLLGEHRTEVYARVVLAERGGTLRVLRFVGEPGAWRTFYGAGGGRITLRPDGYVVLAVDGFEDHWFLEVDRGTESAATLARKLGIYRGYWQSGTEQARHDVFPKVLWLVQDAARVEVIEGVIARQPTETRSLFVVALQEAAVARLCQGAE